MPREYRKRGRRKENDGGREDEDQEGHWAYEAPHEQQTQDEPATKRVRQEDWNETDYMNLDTSYDGWKHDEYDQNLETPHPGGHDEFYGLLNEDDQAYFKRIEAMFELNQFETPEEKELFIESVWREAEGKELKLACSQSCSRILERMIKASRPKHLKQLFQSFSSNFLFLVQHRFASHCCETLFIASAPVVTQELAAPIAPPTSQDPDDDDVYVSMENLFLFTVNELSNNMGFLVTDPFASHSLRVLLIVLSGKPPDDASVISARSGETHDHMNASRQQSSIGKQPQWRTVPTSFRDTVQKTTASIIGGLDTHYLRTLTTNTLASKILQLLIELEFNPSSNARPSEAETLYERLVPEESPTEETEAGRFLKGLLYDQVGSHLLELIVRCAPGKIFKRLYRSFFQPQTATMAKNDIASFVLVRVIERLNADDLRRTVEDLGPEMPMLLSRQRHAVVRALIERCRIRSLDVQPLVYAMEQRYADPGPETLLQLLQPEFAATQPDSQIIEPSRNRTANQHHARLLACSMLGFTDAAQIYLLACLSKTPPPTLLQLALDRHTTFVIQTALTHLSTPLPSRRSLAQSLAPHAPQLAADFVGSYVVAALWMATDGPLFFLKERIIQHLADHEQTVRSTPSGRGVWRNWRVEVWRRDKREWVLKSREMEREKIAKEENADLGTSQGVAKQDSSAPAEMDEHAGTGKSGRDQGGKSALELARERWLTRQKGAGGKGKGKGQDARVVSVR
jgi:hypothetical protein